MTDGTGTRPGGLAALAVVNFILGGLALVGAAMLAGTLGSAEFRAEFEKGLGQPVSDLWLGITLATGVLVAALLVVSAIGYLRQRRVMGRVVGNLYAIVDLGSTAYEITVTGFGVYTLIGLFYPLLTLFLINITFKDDLVR